MTGKATASSLLEFPFDAEPPRGEAVAAAPGVGWVRLPLPIALDHINVWLLGDYDERLIVDCGMADEETRALWRQVFDGALAGRTVSGVLVTHMHPDHVGLAGWLVRHFDVALTMPRTEYLMCRNLVADTGQPAPPEGLAFYRAAGFDEAQLARYAERFGSFGDLVAPLPRAYERLKDGDTVAVGSARWEVIIGAGHSPEHACLYNAQNNVLIAGDQLLPFISPIVGVWPTEPDADPLEEFLASCRLLEERLPPDVLVLPSHGVPFRGAQARLDKLVRHHERALERLLAHCATPRRAVDTFTALFRAPITEGLLIMATAEALAHLNYLVARGRLGVDRDEAGVCWYRAAG
ncbi:MAG: MBL fold metallo-hydrolase [Pseudomonadota bacterium]